MDLSFLSEFRSILNDERDELTRQQFESFVSEHSVTISKSLERSYFSLIKQLDSSSVDFGLVFSHPFIVNLLNASQKKKERDLKKLTEAFCGFILTAGTKNTPAHRNVRKHYSDVLMNEIEGIQSKESSEWVAHLKERLDRKKDQ